MHTHQNTLIITIIILLLQNTWDIGSGLPQFAGYQESSYENISIFPAEIKEFKGKVIKSSIDKDSHVGLLRKYYLVQVYFSCPLFHSVFLLLFLFQLTECNTRLI